MIKDYPLSLLQQAINKALHLDACLAEKIAPLQGKLIQLIISPLDVHFFIEFTTQGLQLTANAARKADTIIHSSPLGFLRLSTTPVAKTRALFNHEVTIQGDLELGLQVKQLFNNLDFDWEGQLVPFTGDVLAHRIGRLVRGGVERMQAIKSSLSQQCTEYLHEELRFFPPPEEVSDFFADIDALSLTVERLEARLNHYRVLHASS